MASTTGPKRKVAFYGSRRQDGYISDICKLLNMLSQYGFEIWVEKKLASVVEGADYRLAVHGIRECRECPKDMDAVVSIGGDGTFLRTARWLRGLEIPIAGINTGHLGFLAENRIEETEKIVKLLSGEDGKIERRMVLEVESEGIPREEWRYALNEVAFLKGATASMVDIKVEADGIFLADYRADGLLMATPTGSTAYNLSVGGPVLAPTLNDIILSPVAPHSLTLRPLVIGAESELKAVVAGRTGDFRLSIDGRSFQLKEGVSVGVRRGRHSVLILRRKDENYISTLRDKLLWGQS